MYISLIEQKCVNMSMCMHMWVYVHLHEGRKKAERYKDLPSSHCRISSFKSLETVLCHKSLGFTNSMTAGFFVILILQLKLIGWQTKGQKQLQLLLLIISSI